MISLNIIRNRNTVNNMIPTITTSRSLIPEYQQIPIKKIPPKNSKPNSFENSNIPLPSEILNVNNFPSSDLIENSFSTSPPKDYKSINDAKGIVCGENNYIPSNSEYLAKGKYTKILAHAKIISNSLNSKNVDQEFLFEPDLAYICSTHREIKEFFLFEKIEGYQIYDIICKYCLLSINSDKLTNQKIFAKNYKEIILENKGKITFVKENIGKIDYFESPKQEITSHYFLSEIILPLADEIIYLTECFAKNISSKICIKTIKSEDLAKLKEIVKSMEMTNLGEILLTKEAIDTSNSNKCKLIGLALFLIKYFQSANFPQLPNLEFKRLTYSLKSHIFGIIQLKNLVNRKFTDWLKFLEEEYFEFINYLEKKSIEKNFFNILKNDDYSKEEDNYKLKIGLENELKIKDEKIKHLEADIVQTKCELEIITKKFLQSQDLSKDNIEENLNSYLIQMENENKDYKKTIISLAAENEKLNQQNTELIRESESLRIDLTSLKHDMESKFLSAIEEIKNEYDKKIAILTSEIIQTKFDSKEMESKLSQNNRMLLLEKEQLLAKSDLLQKKYEMDIKSMKCQLETITEEYEKARMTIINKREKYENYLREKETYDKNLDSLLAQIQEYEKAFKANQIQINTLRREKDTLLTKLDETNIKAERIRNDLVLNTNHKCTLENTLIEYKKRYEILLISYSNAKQEINIKIKSIAKYETQLTELSISMDKINNQIILYLKTIKKYEAETRELKKIIENLRIKKLNISNKDHEIHRLKQVFNICKDDWRRLQHSYEELLIDLKSQISINDKLRVLISNLKEKIDSHNSFVTDSDNKIDQEIEFIENQAQCVNLLDFKLVNNFLIKIRKDIDVLKMKITGMESQKISQKINEIIEDYNNPKASFIKHHLEESPKANYINDIHNIPSKENNCGLVKFTNLISRDQL